MSKDIGCPKKLLVMKYAKNMKYPKSIQNLIDEFSCLPTVGPKTAERYVFYLLQKNKNDLEKFSKALSDLKKGIKICENCFAVTENNLCSICSNNTRDKSTLCIVANTRDMIAIETTKHYNGIYHILGGLINAVKELGPEKLNIENLIKKIQNDNIREIILGLSPDINGETTAMYLDKILKNTNIKITKLARGLPSGSDLEYADELTLGNALKYRVNL